MWSNGSFALLVTDSDSNPGVDIHLKIWVQQHCKQSVIQIQIGIQV